MTISIPDELLKGTHLTEKNIKEQLALILYDKKVFSMAQACRLAEMDRWNFLCLMEKYAVYLNYDENDFADDLKTSEELRKKNDSH